MRGPESTIEAYHIRMRTGYTIRTSLCVSRLANSLGDPELHWVYQKSRCHVTYPYWLVTQSVTSYINGQQAHLGVCCYWQLIREAYKRGGSSTVYYWQQPLPTQVECARPPLHSEYCLGAAQPHTLPREEVWSARPSSRQLPVRTVVEVTM